MRKLALDKKFKPDGSLRFMNPMLERVRSGMVDRHGQSSAYVERERLRGIEEAAIATKGKEHLQSLLDSGIGPSEAKVLHDILTEGHVDNDKMMALAAPIREAIDDLGAEAAELGLISRESYERNRGTYVHRVYEKHESNEGRFAQWATGLGRSRRRKIIGEQFKGRGVYEQVKTNEIFKTNSDFLEGRRGKPQNGDKIIILDRRDTDGIDALPGIEGPKGKLARRVYWPSEAKIPKALANYDNRGTFEVRGTPKGKVTLWRDFSKAERLQMGEIMDARYTVAKTFALMAEDLATGRFFKDIAENDEWSRSTPPDGEIVDEDPMLNSGLKRMWVDPNLDWVKVPDTKIPKSDTFRYGALAGRYVRAEIWRDMEELRILQTPNFFKKMMMQWKLNKSARSPVTHMNNVMSNFILMDMADVRISDLVGALREFALDGDTYKEAAAAGAFGADMVTQELRDNVLKPLLQEMRDDMRGRRGVGRIGTGKGAFEAGIGRLGWVLDRVARGMKTLDQRMINAYQFEDQLFRMATYMRRRQQGSTVEEAAVEARDQFINYDIRAPWINAARATVLPFLSYTYRAIPKIAQTVAERPWKMAKYFAVYQGLNMLAYAAAPSEWGEEEERGSLGDWESGQSWFGTDHMIRMPYLSKGNPVFLNARRWVPGGDVFDMGSGDIPAWLQIGGPIVMAFELYANKQMFTGDEIFNEITDTFPERMWERGKFIYKSAIPSAPWVPGSWYWDKIARARTGEALQWGNNEPYSLPESILSSVGLKLKPKDVEVGYESREFQLSLIERELSGQANFLKRQLKRRLITREVYDKGMVTIQRKRDRIEERREELRRKRR
ncbi:hypothetical protein [Roseobacter sp. SK209-2-6]|uniref:hypothetical protein n=1 Tax=Roseobacter sp. SK209-2-6 TaxID=388739 RepID=UPI000561B5B9|nr:hypothetical protein [Roseobacter sp. SK209-2-6]